MGQSYAPDLRNARMQSIVTFAGANAQNKLYNGTRPASGAAVTSQTLLAELVHGATLGTANAGVLTFSAITGDNEGNAGGTPTWGRIFKSDGTTWVMDYDIPSFPPITAGQPVDITAMTITDGNP